MSKKETGLMFKAPLVRAILKGQKTQTRRVIKDQNIGDKWCESRPDGRQYLEWQGQPTCGSGVWDIPEYNAEVVSPFGIVGDRIYVRETFVQGYKEDRDTGMLLTCDEEGNEIPKTTWYRATTPDLTWSDDGESTVNVPWKPAIHMPKALARIWLEITGVRVERLQDITESDADAEGCERLDFERYERDWALCPKCGGTRLHDALGSGGGVIHDVDCMECDTYVKRFRHLWESTGGDWAANPWVWVIDFKRLGAT